MIINLIFYNTGSRNGRAASSLTCSVFDTITLHVTDKKMFLSHHCADVSARPWRNAFPCICFRNLRWIPGARKICKRKVLENANIMSGLSLQWLQFLPMSVQIHVCSDWQRACSHGASTIAWSSVSTKSVLEGDCSASNGCCKEVPKSETWILHTHL